MMWWPVYLLMGLGVGVLAGMLGIGGGTMLVTLMVLVFNSQGVSPDRVLHLALGTAMATIIFTSVLSFRAHHRHGSVRWDIVRTVAPGLIVGAVLGAVVADYLPSRYLAIVFVTFVYYSATQMILDVKPKPSRQLPGRGVMSSVATIVGALCSLVGAAGGIITIPLLTRCNVPLRQAIGTSAAFGLPVAVTATAGYVWNGLGKDALPPYTLGYVFLPGLVAVIIGTYVTVPMGARLAHRLPVLTLKRVLGLVLCVLATKMLFTLFSR